MPSRLDIVVLGLAVTSSWGNGHATTYRSLLTGLYRRGHAVTFLERDRPWYAQHRDAATSPYWDTELYESEQDLHDRFAAIVRNADAVIVGSYVPDGRRIVDWVLAQARGVRAFYDIDTPVTLAELPADRCSYLQRDQIACFDLMLSFSGGPALEQLRAIYGARRAEALYCSVDADAYRDLELPRDLDLGYMGTYSADRQPTVEAFLNEPARRMSGHRFQVVGPQYPGDIQWPANVECVGHLDPAEHPRFYGRQRFTLNVTRADMRALGYSPSVRLFEAAACATPIISDDWPGLGELFSEGRQILIARRTDDVVEYLRGCSDAQRRRLAAAARERVLAEHTGERRAHELELLLENAASAASKPTDGKRGENLLRCD